MGRTIPLPTWGHREDSARPYTCEFEFAGDSNGKPVVRGICECGYRTGWRYSIVDATSALRWHIDEHNLGISPADIRHEHPQDCICGDSQCPNGENTQYTALR